MKKRRIFAMISIFILMFIIAIGLINPEESIALDFGDFNYSINDDEEITITEYTGSSDEVEIPSNIDDKPVITIGDNAFYNCTSLESVTIPDSVTYIGASAFLGCNSLTNIMLPNNLKLFQKSVFSGCSSLKEITIPNSLTFIGEAVFSGCSSLTSIINLDSVTYVGKSAFVGCSSLTNIQFSENLTTIGTCAFSGSSLTSITIPNSIKRIEYYSFGNCRSLTSIKIPDSVTYINVNAFKNSYNLSEIFGYKNSYAQRYAEENDYIFVSLIKDVNFNSLGGTEIESIIAHHNTKIIEPLAPIKTGYEFVDWYKEETLDNHWDFDIDIITEDITLYAKWVKSQHYTATPQVQLLKGTNRDSLSTSMRFLSTIENLDYSEVGFVISNINSNPEIGEYECITYSTTTVFKKIKAGGDLITTDVLGSGRYIMTITLHNISNELFSSDVYVKPYVKLMDGTIYYGNMSTFSVDQCLEELRV